MRYKSRKVSWSTSSADGLWPVRRVAYRSRCAYHESNNSSTTAVACSWFIRSYEPWGRGRVFVTPGQHIKSQKFQPAVTRTSRTEDYTLEAVTMPFRTLLLFVAALVPPAF